MANRPTRTGLHRPGERVLPQCGGNLIASRSRATRAPAVPPSRNPPPPHAPGAAPAPPWTHEFLRRVRRQFLLKAIGITGFMWVFFTAYFHLLRNPARPVFEMPLLALDHWVPFEPSALVAYVSLWVYVGLPAGLMQTLRQSIAYGLWAGVLCAAGLLCFYLWPTAVPPMAVPVDVKQHPGFALLQGVDAAGNACPSLHVATAVFTAVWVGRQLRQIRAATWAHAINGVWALLIVWSTLATKQHVALDVAAGTLLALLMVPPSMRWFPATLGAAAEGGR